MLCVLIFDNSILICNLKYFVQTAIYNILYDILKHAIYSMWLNQSSTYVMLLQVPLIKIFVYYHFISAPYIYWWMTFGSYLIKFVICRADLFSESQRIKYTIEQQTQGIPDARTYLLMLQEIRIKYIQLMALLYFFVLYLVTWILEVIFLLCLFFYNNTL